MEAPTIASMALSALKPAPYNPRKISPDAMAGLEASIDRFGNVQPIIFNKRSGLVVGGHQRLKALKKRKVKETSVVVVDLSETDEKALNIALNSSHIAGEFTDDLQKILESIQLADETLFESLLFDELFGDGAPSFEPEDMDALKRLDEKKMITCPSCGHEFSPGS